MQLRRALPGILAIFILVLTLVWPGLVYADGVLPANSQPIFPKNLQECAPGFPPEAYTERIVYCIRGTIIISTLTIMAAISEYMKWTVGVMLMFAIIMFSFRILSNEKMLMVQTISVLMRLTIFFVLSYNLAGFGGYIFDITDELVRIATGNYSPWPVIDYFIGRLIGFAPGYMISQGFIGLIGASAASSSTGFILFLAGVAAFLDIFFFIIRVIYLYLNALLTIGFMLVISPLIIPLGMFFYTERYVKKWMDITISAILTPMLLFAFLYMFLGIFRELILGLFAILGDPNNPDFKALWKTNQPAFSWLMPSDPNAANMVKQTAGNTKQATAAVQSFINPLLARGFDANTWNFPGIHFGARHNTISQALTAHLVAIWIFASLMKTMVSKIPEVAAGIPKALSGLRWEESAIESQTKAGIKKLKSQIENRG